MSTKNNIFYRTNVCVSVDFSSEEISSDGAIVLLEQLERKNNTIFHMKLLHKVVSFDPHTSLQN